MIIVPNRNSILFISFDINACCLIVVIKENILYFKETKNVTIYFVIANYVFTICEFVISYRIKPQSYPTSTFRYGLGCKNSIVTRKLDGAYIINETTLARDAKMNIRNYWKCATDYSSSEHGVSGMVGVVRVSWAG